MAEDQVKPVAEISQTDEAEDQLESSALLKVQYVLTYVHTYIHVHSQVASC